MQDKKNGKFVSYNFLLKKLEKAIMYAKYVGQHVALLYIKFHDENDIAEEDLMKPLLKLGVENQTIFKLKTRECYFLFKEFIDIKDVGNLARKILLDYKQIAKVKIGIAVFPMGGLNADELIDNAKKSTLKQMSSGNESLGWRFFKVDVHTKIQRLIQIEDELRHAIKNNELNLLFQPQFDLSTDQLIGAEALLRWNHPNLGAISPAEFIKIAEKNNLIFDLGRWVIDESIKNIKNWSKYKKIKIAINISPKQLASHYFVESILEPINKLQIDPTYLEIEITENELIHDMDDHIKKLNNLTDHGISLALDDYGTGFSTMHYLKVINLSKLKIDQSFIKSLHYSASDKIIVKSTIDMSHNLGFKVLAEGVETIEQKQYLTEMKCDYVQGYLFSKPLTAQDFELLILKSHF